MRKSIFKAVFEYAGWILIIFTFLGYERGTGVYSEKTDEGSIEVCTGSKILQIREEILSESWMGIYMNGIKIGYSHTQEISLLERGDNFKKSCSESCLRISRLGGAPVSIVTIHELLYNEQGEPLESLLKVKMSESETVIKAEIFPDRVVFTSGSKLIKEVIYKEKFYLEVPVKKIINEEGLTQGKRYNFHVLDPFSYSLVKSSFEIAGKENVLLLGKVMTLWHVKTETDSFTPISLDEWIDNEGNCWKSECRTGLANTTSILMSKERALEVPKESLDIAFSTLVRSNIIFDNPREVQEVTFKISGIPLDAVKNFPFDDESQRIVELKGDHALIQTSSLIFLEREALTLPIEGEELDNFLKPTFFCQSDDPEIQKEAEIIVDREKNAWRAAKRIARWVKVEIASNYDIGFASAREVLKNREGDCSEHTVLFVAICRAAGIPARAAVGIMYAQGIFAYHMWPEVYVGRWVGLDSKWLAVDKKSGEYYTDATHLKFGQSNLDADIFKEMAQAISEIIGQLKLEIIDYSQDK